MSLREKIRSDENTLDQLAGITGLGWTTSMLGFLGTAFGYGSSLVAKPTALLYLGGAFFLATVGLDRLRNRQESEADGDVDPETEGELSVVVE